MPFIYESTTRKRSVTMYMTTIHPATLTHCSRLHHNVSPLSGANISLEISSQQNEKRKYVLTERTLSSSIGIVERIESAVKDAMNSRKFRSFAFGSAFDRLRKDHVDII